MKALPLWQPYASLIAIGGKKIETRAYPPRRLGLVEGDRIAIYATKTLGTAGEYGFRTTLFDPWIGRALRDAGVPTDSRAIPRGVILCTCVLARASAMTTESVRHARVVDPAEVAYGHWAPGRWAWALTDVERLDPPVEPPAGGCKQGSFDWWPDGQPVADTTQEQLAL